MVDDEREIPLTLKGLRRNGEQTIVEVGMECYQLTADLDAARARIAALESDPRLAVPRDGPGSHRADLAAYRVAQERIAELEAQVTHLGGACDYSDKVRAVHELRERMQYDRLTAERDALAAEVAGLRAALVKGTWMRRLRAWRRVHPGQCRRL